MGSLGTPKGESVREKCKKIKDAAKIAAAVSIIFSGTVLLQLANGFYSHSTPIRIRSLGDWATLDDFTTMAISGRQAGSEA